MKQITLLSTLLLVFTSFVSAAPSPDLTRQVLDHYWSGDSPVLVEYKFCSEIAKEGENKNQCAVEADPAAIAKGDKVFLWMNYMVPKDTAQNISVLITRNSRPEKTRDLKVTGSLRYRAWTTLPTDKSGTYAIQVDHEINDSFTALEKLGYTVAE